MNTTQKATHSHQLPGYFDLSFSIENINSVMTSRIAKSIILQMALEWTESQTLSENEKAIAELVLTEMSKNSITSVGNRVNWLAQYIG